MGPNWYDREMQRLEDDYAAGLIDYGTLHNQQRELTRELRDAAEEASRDAYDDYVDRY